MSCLDNEDLLSHLEKDHVPTLDNNELMLTFGQQGSSVTFGQKRCYETFGQGLFVTIGHKDIMSHMDNKELLLTLCHI